MALKHADVTERREDFSRYMVHLTRDDRDETRWIGMTAKENFESILLNEEIVALDTHCLHRKQIPDKYRDRFKVCCFTETPLDQIEHLVGHIPGRSTELEGYGVVFEREFMLRQNAQQVKFVNTYGSDEQKESYDALFEIAMRANFNNKSWRVLPHVSAMHDRYDFSWEREWRVRGTLKFTSGDVHCVILPDDDDEDLRDSLLKKGVSFICPGWGYERIVAEMAAQMKQMKKLLTPKVIVPVRKTPMKAAQFRRGT